MPSIQELIESKKDSKEVVNNLTEQSSMDAQYFIDNARDMMDDFQRQEEKEFISNLLDLVNQQHPDGDISKKKVMDLSGHHTMKGIDVDNTKEIIDYLWDGMR